MQPAGEIFVRSFLITHRSFLERSYRGRSCVLLESNPALKSAVRAGVPSSCASMSGSMRSVRA